MPIRLPRLAMPRSRERHIGFLTFNRQLLAIGSIAAVGAFTIVPSIPASAEIVHEEVMHMTAQSFSTSADTVIAPVVRDGFATSSFSIVQWPVPASTPISSWFGYRTCSDCPTDHRGIDFTPGSGYPIDAIATGVVVEASTVSDYGVHVIVEHVINGTIVRSHYAHMLEGSMAVSVGDTVERGQQLGLVGNTGISTGAHLHFAIIIGGVEIDPYAWLLATANA